MNILIAILARFFRRPEPVVAENPKPAPAEIPVIDPRMLQIKQIVILHLNRQPFDSSLLNGLSERTRLWLSLLDKEMLLKIAKATPSAIKDHMKGRRMIRGVLAADAESIEAYRTACRPRSIHVDTEGRRGGGGGPKRSMGSMKMGR